MPQKTYKPTSPGIRAQSHPSFDEITKTRPEKSLTKGKRSTGGRNNRGRITSRFMGGGHKRRHRQVDFRREKHGISAKVAAIEYDPNRTARIALLYSRSSSTRMARSATSCTRKGFPSATRLFPGPAPTAASVMCFRFVKFRSAPTCTTSS